MTVAPFPSASSVPVPAATRGPTRPLHLAAAIDGPGGSAELSPDGPAGPEAVCAALARLAERGALDFVTLDAAPPTAADGASGHLAALPPPYPGDPLTLLARVAGTTDRIGLIAGVAAPATDDPPSVRAAAVASAIAALDRASQGRAGWAVGPAEDGSAPRRRAAERFVAAVVRAWTVPSAPPSGRHPITVLDATDPATRTAAARYADIAVVRTQEPEPAGRIGAELRLLAAEAGRDPDRLLVFAELRVDLGGGELGPEPGVEIALAPDGAGGVLFCGGPVDLADLIGGWRRAGAVDGFHIRPVEPRRDLERFVNGTVALLQHRGLFRTFHPGGTLREHLGLHRPPRRR